MIKELTKNPKKEFRHKNMRDHVVFMSKAGTVMLKIQDSNTLNSPLILDGMLRDEWEEIKKPVTFQEVLEAIEVVGNYTRITFIYERDNLRYRNETLDSILEKLLKAYSPLGISRAILEGEWYIED